MKELNLVIALNHVYKASCFFLSADRMKNQINLHMNSHHSKCVAFTALALWHRVHANVRANLIFHPVVLCYYIHTILCISEGLLVRKSEIHHLILFQTI